ncbi:MAG: 5-formyltetrahydrofolate cyclo-ligase [Planctomycetota bacterium]
MTNIQEQKESLRQLAKQARQDQKEKDTRSQRILDRVINLPDYQSANTVMWYVDVRDEVRTRGHLKEQLETSKSIVVPYCFGRDLHLFHLVDFEDLMPGHFGILEPSRELVESQQRSVRDTKVDLVIVPGVAFDTLGNRLGHGKGFYDRWFTKANSNLIRVGVAFDCQVFPSVPCEPHDMKMNHIITESQHYKIRLS